MADGLLAFEGAEGFGAGTVGGRGGQIVHVTNLNDTGEGSLRWALETVKGPRTIVFDVNGTITLSRQILIEDGYVTIAGQTAPGGGIVIEGSRLRIDASEVIVRGLMFRPGDGEIGTAPDDRDGLFIGSTDNIVNNVIIDHNSFEWAIDQNVAATGRVQNITFSNNIIAQGLSESLHSKGEHSKGAGTGPWSTNQWDANNHISFIKNLMADNTARNPEVGSGDAIEMINNYIFNYGMGHIGSAFGNGTAALDLKINAIGNVYQPGLDTVKSTHAPIWLGRMGVGSAVYLEDNLFVGRPTDTAGNQTQSGFYWSSYGSQQYVVTNPGFAGSATQILDSQQVAAYVLANAGARPYDRDAVDARLVAEVASGTSRIIDTPAEAGGPAANPPVAPATDSDRDGMPDWFENRYGFNRLVADDKGDSDSDGFTNIEEYLNGLFTGFDIGPAPAGSPPPADASPPVSTVPTAGTPPVEPAPVVSAPAPAPSLCPVYVRGTSKNDTLTVRAATDLVIEEAAGGTDLVVAYVNYTLGNNLENLSLKGDATRAIGNSLANAISGSTGNDFVDGQAGDDKVKGMDGNDEVLGGAGNDWLEGNSGHDILNGGSGTDTLCGGQGADTFCFDSGDSIATATMAGDRVADFEIGDCITVDGATLDLASLPDLYVARANHASAFSAAETLTMRGADCAIIHGDSDSWLFWDANGDGHVDNGVTLALASLTRSAWAGPDGTL